MPDAAAAPATCAVTPRAYRCRCGGAIYFRNSRCLACGSPLGYLPGKGLLCTLEASSAPHRWLVAGDVTQTGYLRCGNYATPAACNWLVETDGDECSQRLCRACCLNRTIPDLTQRGHGPLWLGMERAKRRLVSQLIGLGLPVRSKVLEDPSHGLAYDFLRNRSGQPAVMTGHHRGVITINLDEADDAVRERTRVEMGEPYRTLLGHFRHEIGHYYWWRLVAGTRWEAPGRQLFGDERADYAAAIRLHYQRGAPVDWRDRFVSAYASVHPMEDWAECWAHYLHLRDTLDTAISFGVINVAVDDTPAPFSSPDLWLPDASDGPGFLAMLHRWIHVTGVMNEMSRAMGQHDFYPFVLPRPAVAKLHLIHRAITESSAQAAAQKELT